MQIIRDLGVISGFRYEAPLEELPLLTHCGEAVCRRGHRVPGHTHRVFEFLYLVRGAMRQVTGGQEYLQQAGDLFIAFPGVRHQLTEPGEVGSHHLWWGLDLAAISPAGRELATALRRRQLHLVRGCSELEPVVRLLIHQVVVRGPRVETIVRHGLEMIVELVAQKLEIGSGPMRGQPYSYPIEKVIDYMRRVPDRRLALNELARACGQSQSWLCHQFRKEVGMPPAAYHLRLRLESMREALRREDCTLADTAMEHGFSSSQHAGNAFRRAFGMTPGEWQRRLARR